jgi:dienelactone hydrolase
MKPAEFTLSEFFNRMLVYPNAALSPDGTRIAYISSVSGGPQIWIADVPREGLLPYPRPLTSSRKIRPYIFELALAWLDRDRLACVFETEGDERTYIEILNLATGEVIPVPRGDAQSRDFLGFVGKEPKHGDCVYFTSNRSNPRIQGLFRFSLSRREVTSLYQDPKHNSVWYPKAKHRNHLLFAVVYSNVTNRLMGVNPANGKTVTLFDRPDSAIKDVVPLDRDRILVTTTDGREFFSPAVLTVGEAGKSSLRFLGKDRWDQEIQLSPGKKTLLINENQAGRSVLSLHQWPSMKVKSLRFPKDGVIDRVSFTQDGRFALVAQSSSTTPRNYHRVDLRSGKIQKLTDNYVSRVPHSNLVPPRLVKYRSEKRTIHSWFFLPRQAKRDGSLPVVVWPHGGPQWQERPQQRPIFQYLLSRGYAIWAPNHSGSTGFGKTCAKAIERAWGTADLPDMENGIRWLKESGWIDPARMAIMGGSYGGYMTLRSITRFPDVFRAAIDIFGVANLLTMTASMPEDWKQYSALMVGDPVKDRAMLVEQSPVFEIDRIRCPLLVIQGANDPRVTQAESDQIVEALRKKNHPVEYLVFPDEGHGFFKLENELAAFGRAAEFIEKYLG